MSQIIVKMTIQRYEEILEQIETFDSFEDAQAICRINYMDWGVCWYMKRCYKIDFLPRSDWFWCDPPSRCNTIAKIIEVFRTRISILKEYQKTGSINVERPKPTFS